MSRHTKIKFYLVLMPIIIPACQPQVPLQEKNSVADRKVVDSGQRIYTSNDGITENRVYTEFMESGVRVQVALATDWFQKDVLSISFTPEKAGFHLYGMELDVEKSSGVGVATSVEVEAGGGWATDGPGFVMPQSEARTYPDLGVTIPVYPEGPVNLYIPVRLNAPDKPTDIFISYMACQDDGVCLSPVIRKKITLQ